MKSDSLEVFIEPPNFCWQDDHDHDHDKLQSQVQRARALSFLINSESGPFCKDTLFLPNNFSTNPNSILSWEDPYKNQALYPQKEVTGLNPPPQLFVSTFGDPTTRHFFF